LGPRGPILGKIFCGMVHELKVETQGGRGGINCGNNC
jgi:hypothetical protein